MPNSYCLLLDDKRSPKRQAAHSILTPVWIVARSHRSFIDTINTLGVPAFISFDHDLGGARTGADCARWLAEHCLDTKTKIPRYQVHDDKQPVGAAAIRSIMECGKRLEGEWA